jgi:hypothetical protein
MQFFSVDKKTGYCSHDSPVLIFEKKRNKLFYYHRGNLKGRFFFNLPKGEYFTNNRIEKCIEPIPVELPILPPPEKNKQLPNKVKVQFLENPNKASILVDKHKIFVDHKIMKLSLPSIIFVLFHEIGHYYYIDEKKMRFIRSQGNVKTWFQSFAVWFGY